MVQKLVLTLHGSLEKGRGWLLARRVLTLLVVAYCATIRFSDSARWSRADVYFGCDVMAYRQAALGDTQWLARQYPETFRYGFIYGEGQRQAFKIFTFVEAQTAIVGMYWLNVLLMVYIGFKICEVPYGFLLWLVVGVKTWLWVLGSGNISILSVALCFTPLGSAIGALVKPYGLGVAFLHAVRGPDGAGPLIRLSHRQLALPVACVVCLFSWHYWLSPATRQLIFNLFN